MSPEDPPAAPPATADEAAERPPERPSKADLLSTPVEQIDLSRIETVGDLVDAFAGASIQARTLGECAKVWENMLTDEDRPTVILGLAGPLIAAGLRKVLRDLIAHDLVDVVVSTGAIFYQDFYQARGFDHYKGHPEMDDLLLRDHFIDRIYDTLVDEEKFRETDRFIGELARKLEPRAYSSREFLRILGEHVDDEDSIVGTAARTGTPLFAPALNDSSIGIGLVAVRKAAKDAGEDYMVLDQVRDAYELAQVKYRSEKTGVIYLAGGISKNYIQQTEVISEILGHDPGGHQYAFQVTTLGPQWGSLSGCTLKEAQSWGKIAREAKKAECYSDVTIALPILAKAMLERKERWAGRPRLAFEWDDDELVSLGPAE